MISLPSVPSAETEVSLHLMAKSLDSGHFPGSACVSQATSSEERKTLPPFIGGTESLMETLLFSFFQANSGNAILSQSF